MAETLLINGISFQPGFLLHPQRLVSSLSQTQLPLTWVMPLFHSKFQVRVPRVTLATLLMHPHAVPTLR